jgi:hypothetical protein
MHWSGIVEGIVSTILCAAGVTLLTWVKTKWPKYGDLALYWLATAACIAVIWFTVTGVPLFASKPLAINQANAEETVSAWLSETLISFRKAKPSEVADAKFAFFTTAPNNNQVIVDVPNDHPNMILISATVDFGPNQRNKFAALSQEGKNAAGRFVNLELARLGVQYSVDMPRGVISVEKPVMLDGLREQVFVDNLTAIESAILLSESATDVGLDQGALVAKSQ